MHRSRLQSVIETICVNLRKLRKLPVAIAMLVLIEGCVSVFAPVETIDTKIQKQWFAHQSLINQIEHWEINGKISLRYGGSRASFNLNWQCQPQRIYFNLRTALGQRVLEFEVTPVLVEIRDRGGDYTYHNFAQDFGMTFSTRIQHAETLIKDRLGFALPVTYMCNWGKGIPSPDKKVLATQFNKDGSLESFTQSNWSLQYKSYMHTLVREAMLALPQRIVLRKGPIELVLLAKDWQYKQPGSRLGRLEKTE